MDTDTKSGLITAVVVCSIVMGVVWGIFALVERYDNKMVERGYVYISVPSHWEKAK